MTFGHRPEAMGRHSYMTLRGTAYFPSVAVQLCWMEYGGEQNCVSNFSVPLRFGSSVHSLD